MKNMIIKDRDYTGCDPDIKEVISNGKAIYCECLNYYNATVKKWIVDYVWYPFSNDPSVYVDENINFYKSAKPATPKIKVKKASEIVKWLEDNGYEVDKYGNWLKNLHTSFSCGMFQFCGNDKPDIHTWLPEWLEEAYE